MGMANFEIVNAGVESSCDDLMQTGEGVKESENLGVNLLADLDSYLQDVNDRLTISRMVSDSVIKGMVTAVTQEAVEKIAQKEQEVVGLKEILHVYRSGRDEKESLRSSAMQHKSKGTKHGTRCSFSEAVIDHDRMDETLGCLRSVCGEQFARVKKEINWIQGCCSMKKISSSSELLGLGGILHEQSSERWSDADKMLDSLRATLETVFKGVVEIVRLSKSSLHEWKQEQEFQAEIEALVMGNCIRSLEQEYEGKLWDRISDDKSTKWSGRMKEISSLREELEAISKSLCVPEGGQLVSHGSLDGEGLANGKKSHFHHKVLGNHVTAPASLWEANGKHEESETNKPENLDPNSQKLKHLTKDEAIAYYNNELTKMRRSHESKVQEMTEEYFRLKREYLTEKGSSLLLKKDKEFDTLKKKIPDIVSKLDDILVENEKLPAVSNNAGSLNSLKDRLEALLAENRQLRDFLTDKKKEVKCLEAQVYDATDKMSKHSLSEPKLLNIIEYLRSDMEDLSIQASIGADVFTCLLGEMMGEIKCIVEGSYLEWNIMQEFYESRIKEASLNAQRTSQHEVEDTDMLSIITQGLCETIYRESWREAKDKMNMLNMKYIDENEVRISLEKVLSEKERELEIEVADKERLKQEKLFLVEEKERLAEEVAAALNIERGQFQLAAEELEYLRLQTYKQQIIISRSNEELAEALREIKLYEKDISELNKKLEVVGKELREADVERRTLLAVNKEKQNAISVHEANEREVRKQMVSIFNVVNGLSKNAADLERRVTEDISKNCLRLNKLSSQSCLLIQKANILKRTGLLYKQRLERRCADLQKAEAEVDLLGDKVETLLSLLEKIYIALDHYSPVLQHYPGIVETLKLVKRELTVESTRPV